MTGVPARAVAPGGEVTQVAAPLVGSSEPTYYSTNRRMAVTAGGRRLVVYGRHGTGVQLAWRDATDTSGQWRTDTTGAVSNGLLLGGADTGGKTGTGDWPASIAIAKDSLGVEHAWAVFGYKSFSSVKPIRMRHLSELDAAGGPKVGPVVTVSDAPAGDARPDIAFDLQADGSITGVVSWLQKISGSTVTYKFMTRSFTDVAADTPALGEAKVVATASNANATGTLVPSSLGGMRFVARTGRLKVYSHDPSTDSWSAWQASVGSVSSKARPSAVELASGDILVTVEANTKYHKVEVVRFRSTGSSACIDMPLTTSGYWQPTIATDGANAWVFMVRKPGPYVVSRQSAASASDCSSAVWSADQEELAPGDPPNGTGGYAWPNLVRQTDSKLRLVVEGPNPTSSQSAVLAYERPLVAPAPSP